MVNCEGEDHFNERSVVCLPVVDRDTRMISFGAQRQQEGLGGVRVTVGVPKRTHSERRTIAVEQFLSMLRFEQRDKLAGLPGGWR